MLRKTLTDIAVRTLDSTPVSGLMKGLRNRCVPIFMIHRVENTALHVRGHNLQVIEDALRYLQQNRYQVISLRTLAETLQNNAPLPERSVVFTIDDGFSDQTNQIIPIFQKHNAPVTLFVATNLVDNQGWSWDFKLDYAFHHTHSPEFLFSQAGQQTSFKLGNFKEKRAALRFVRDSLKTHHPKEALQAVEEIAEELAVPLPEKAPKAFEATTWQQLRELESEIVEFAPHSVNHVILSRLKETEAEQEIMQSWKRLQEELSNPVPVFCYPTGRHGKDFAGREKKIVNGAGIKTAVSSDPGYVLSPGNQQDNFALPRFSMPSDNLSEFIKYCSWIERGRQLITGNV